MKRMMLLFFLLAACQTAPSTPWQYICGRGDEQPLYRARLADGWERTDYSGGKDTRIANVGFSLGEVDVVVHTFPGMTIPPEAQVHRWQGQLEKMGSVTREAHGGFWGLRLESPGMIAWAMQLDDEHLPMIRKKDAWEELAAPYTIKVTGPAAAIASHREEIERFAHSFELIEPIL